jgi:hypothetical protein
MRRRQRASRSRPQTGRPRVVPIVFNQNNLSLKPANAAAPVCRPATRTLQLGMLLHITSACRANIKELRRKLGPHGLRVETVRGAGYRYPGT